MRSAEPSGGSVEEKLDKKVHVRGQHHSLDFWEHVQTTRTVAIALAEVSEFRA